MEILIEYTGHCVELLVVNGKSAQHSKHSSIVLLYNFKHVFACQEKNQESQPFCLHFFYMKN